MSDLFKDILSSDESLFLNPQFLDSDFIPPIIKFRENEQQYIASCIKPLLLKRDGKNILIKGSPGIGKTLASKHVISELKKESNEIFCVYVNCWKKDSSFKILNEICSQLSYKYVFNKSFDVLMKDICELINQKSLVIILDEIDRLTDNTILYSLLEDIYRKSIIMITNDDEFLTTLDARIRSRMIPENLDFKSYNTNEIDSILRERAEYAFVKNVMSDECFELISEKTSEFKDLRTGLFLLKESGEIAESKSSRKITKEHTMIALEKLNASIIKEVKDENKDVLDLIKSNSGKTTAEIFKEYEFKHGKSYRTFQRKIKDLEKMNMITLKELNKGREGRSTIVEFNQKMLVDY